MTEIKEIITTVVTIATYINIAFYAFVFINMIKDDIKEARKHD